jgi:hypothetical protein
MLLILLIRIFFVFLTKTIFSEDRFSVHSLNFYVRNLVNVCITMNVRMPIGKFCASAIRRIRLPRTRDD